MTSSSKIKKKWRKARSVYRQKNREIIKAKAKEYAENHHNAVLLSTARSRAKRRGLEFKISLKDVVIPKVCPVLQIPLKKGVPNNPSNPSLDRVDNTKGYVPGNVEVISLRANRLKSDGTLAEHEAIVRYLLRRLK